MIARLMDEPKNGRTKSACDRLVGILSAGILMTSCATGSFTPVSLDETGVVTRAQTQHQGPVRVRASVPGEAEARAIFGAPLYDRGIQPVWLEISNDGPVVLRFAPTGTDRDYFAPLEVAYMHRAGFSGGDLQSMERFFHEIAMPRVVRPGEKRSGFVFTHLDPGTKSFNVDIFGADESGDSDYHFTFFVPVPGFEPDHAAVDFDALYDASALEEITVDELPIRQQTLECCAMDPTGPEQGLPINVLLVAPGRDLLQALLRSGWNETSRTAPDAEADARPRWEGRPPDAIFRRARGKSDRNELRLWLSAVKVDDDDLWVAQVTHAGSGAARLESDIDDARNYMLQSLWYGQSLTRFAWLDDEDRAVPFDAPRTSVSGRSYFTDGSRLVMWLSGTPVAMAGTAAFEWGTAPKAGTTSP